MTARCIQAIQLGFCGADQEPAGGRNPRCGHAFKGDKAVGIGLVGTGFMYNTKYFDEKGWADADVAGTT